MFKSQLAGVGLLLDKHERSRITVTRPCENRTMNRLSTERRGQVISYLCEGMSIRGTVRVTGVAKNTITKLVVDLGAASSEYQDGVLTNLGCKRLSLTRSGPLWEPRNAMSPKSTRRLWRR